MKRSTKLDIGKTLKTIQDAEGNQQITKDQANKLAYGALSSMVGEPTKKEAKETSNNEIQDLANTAGQNKAALKVNKPSGEQIEVDARPSPAPAAAIPVKEFNNEITTGISAPPIGITNITP